MPNHHARPRPIAASVVAALLALALTPALAGAKPIEGEYIVTLKEGHDPTGIAKAIQANPKHVYTSALNGFSAELNQGQLNALRHNPGVELVEQNAEVSATITQTMDASGDPWGLDRIDQLPLPLSKTYAYSKSGSGVRAYILDTGLQADHPQFGSRALNVYNATSGSAIDCHGHGTHVGGTVGATTFGVAKSTLLRGVKVIGGDCSKNGDWADVIEGIDWVKANAIKPAVANLSVGGGKLTAVNTAVNNLSAAGVFVAVSAGNDNVDACTQSPASAVNAYTTASSTKTDAKSGFSNWGACVDGYAPGSSIKSSTLGGGSGWMSGTSMASPHVAGVGAILCSYGGPYCTPSVMAGWINESSNKDVITANPAGTPNRLLYAGGI